MPVSDPSSKGIRRFPNKQGAKRTVPVRLAQPSSARRQTRAANDPASAEQRDEGRTCDRERGRRKGDEQADAADDPIPREERRADPLLLRERERGVVRDEVPRPHEGTRDLDERTEVEGENQRRACDA